MDAPLLDPIRRAGGRAAPGGRTGGRTGGVGR